jgi:hypothetical protein
MLPAILREVLHSGLLILAHFLLKRLVSAIRRSARWQRLVARMRTYAERNRTRQGESERVFHA